MNQQYPEIISGSSLVITLGHPNAVVPVIGFHSGQLILTKCLESMSCWPGWLQSWNLRSLETFETFVLVVMFHEFMYVSFSHRSYRFIQKKLLDHHSSMEVFPPNSSIFRRSLTSSTQVCLAPCAAPRLWGPIWLKLRWQPSDTCFGKYFDKKRVVQEKQHMLG